MRPGGHLLQLTCTDACVLLCAQPPEGAEFRTGVHVYSHLLRRMCTACMGSLTAADVHDSPLLPLCTSGPCQVHSV